jgi:hypothetical protein
MGAPGARESDGADLSAVRVHKTVFQFTELPLDECCDAEEDREPAG